MKKGFLRRIISIFLATAMCLSVTASVVSADTTNDDITYVVATQRIRRGDKLTGLNKSIYYDLCSKIGAVASGNLTSTVFDIKPILDEDPRTFTESSLGVSFNDSDKMVNAVLKAYGIDQKAILNALIYDFPYDLYWFDKLNGAYVSMGFDLITYGNEPTQATISTATMKFYVSQEFREGSDYFTVSGKFRSLAQNAEKKAESIVAKYAGVSDYEKLDGYRKEICDLTSYNFSAAKGGIPYGNPWQVLWVFDGDPNTTVVCEGYTKAFQWLCDMTDFLNYSITSIMPSGVTNDEIGGNGHTWNIVTMGDGKNYVVDVTNCDTGAFGEGRGMFLVGTTSGSVENGYTFTIDGSSLTYKYDAETKADFDKSELTIASGYYYKVEQIKKAEEKKEETVPKPVTKKANTLSVKPKSPIIKAAKLKNKAQSIGVKKAFAVSGAKGKVSYKKKSGNKNLTITSAGKITVKKGTKKGQYKIVVTVTAAGNAEYKPGSKVVTVKVKVS